MTPITTRIKKYRVSSAISRSIRRGLPHAIEITTADKNDRQGGLEAIDRYRSNLHSIQSVRVDGGYTGQSFADAIKQRLDATVQVAKRPELHTFAAMPKRWVVERSFAWLEKCDRLWKNCERYLDTSLQFANLEFFVLLLRGCLQNQ